MATVAPGASTDQPSHARRRPLAWIGVGVMAATAVFAPIRIAYKHNQHPKSAPGQVVISNFAFDANALTVKSGTSVTFVNKDGANHTATADDGSFDSGRLSTGATFATVITKSVSYHCSIHSYMTAKITVG